MEHIMKLQDEYYNYILNGTKRIEIRLNDLKRQKINIGDTIKFLNVSKLDEYFYVKVIDLLKYDSFEELINNNDITLLADRSISKEELLSILDSFYTKKEQGLYGVVGIKIELVK